MSENGKTARELTLEARARRISEIQAEFEAVRVEGIRLSQRMAQLESSGPLPVAPVRQPPAVLAPSAPVGVDAGGQSVEERHLSRRGVLRAALGGATVGGMGLAIGSKLVGAEPATTTPALAASDTGANTADLSTLDEAYLSSTYAPVQGDFLQYLPPPSGSAVTDTANLVAADAAAVAAGGGMIYGRATPTSAPYQINAAFGFSPGVGFQGSGAGKDNDAGTCFMLTIAEAQIGVVTLGGVVTNRGPYIGDFSINANGIATTPWLDQGVQRTYGPISISNSAGAGATISGAQNNTYISLDCEDGVGPGLVFDLGAGNNIILRHENNNNGSGGYASLVYQQSGASPSGAFAVPTLNTIIKGQFERPPTGNTGLVYHGAGQSNRLDNPTLSCIAATSAYTAIYVTQAGSGASQTFMVNDIFAQGESSSTYCTLVKVDPGCTVQMGGGYVQFFNYLAEPTALSALITFNKPIQMASVSNLYPTSSAGYAAAISARVNGALVFGSGVGSAFDVGLTRASAGVLQVSDGASGDGALGIGSFYIPNPTLPNIIMGPQASGSDDSAEVNGMLGDIASGPGEGRLELPGSLYLFDNPVVMQSNVDIKAKATFRAMSGLTSGGLIVASHDNPVTDATLDGITVDGGYSQYGSALSGVLWSEATRLKFVNGQIVNCGGMGLSMHHGSTNCKFVLSDINGAGLSDGLGGAGVNISGSTGCLVALSTFLNCVCFGILGQRSALTARIIGNYLDKTNNPTVAASGAWSGGDLETLTSPITAGFPQQGSVVVPGFGSVTYTGLDPGGAGFTGCTPSSGTVANGAPILSGFENIGFQWTCADWVVQGNQSIGSRDNGISADGPEAVVTGNLVDTCQYDGIFSLSAGTTITGNTIRNPGSVGAHLGYSGVNLNATSGNIVNGNQAVDTRGGSACMEYGFRETGAGSLNQFGINSSVGHTNSPYSLVPGTTSFVQVTGTTGQTDASTITPNATAGLQEAITVTDGSAFTIQDPDYPFPGATMTIVLVNASGGTMGTITWGAAYTFVNDSGSLAGPPNGAISTITFYYNGTSWIETARSTATIPASSA